MTFQLSAQTNIWDGSSSNNWNTAANWSLNSVPSSSHDVVININANISVDASSTINSLVISNSAAVTFTSSGGGRIITIDNSGSTISTGSILTLKGSTGSGNRSMRIAYAGSNCTMLIEGSLILTAVGKGTSYVATNSLTTVSGTIKNDGSGGGTAGSITSTASNLTFLPGGTYEHALNGGSIPTATWNTTSICLVNGVTSTIPAGLVQNFANLIYNCPAQSVILNITTTQILGNFEIISTGNFQLRLNTTTLTVGSFTQSGGDFAIASTTARTFNINGNLTLSGGILTLSIGSGVGSLNLKGDFTQSGGLITETSTGSGAINFTGTELQVFTSGGTISNVINFNINNGSIVDFGTSILAGSSGSFTLSSGAGIITANTNPSGAITTSGSNGSVQVTGTRSFSTGANYTYNGASTQFTGNGLPSTVNDLTINNSGGTVTLTNASVTISSHLTLNSIIETGTNSVIVNTAATVVRTNGHVNGNLQLKNSVGASIKTFDIGDAINYTPVSISIGSITTAGGITASTTIGDHPNIGTSDISNALSINRYWTISNNGTAFTSYTADFTFVASDVDPGVDYSNFIAGKYLTSAWTYPTFDTATLSNVQVSGLTTFGDFQFGESLSSSPCAYGDIGSTPTVSGYTPCINIPSNPVTVSSTFSAHQYFTMNVIKGLTYEVFTCNTTSPAFPLKMVVYKEGAPSEPFIAASNKNTGNTCTSASNNVYLNFTPTFSGQVRVLINRKSDCSSTTPSGITVKVNVTGGSNQQDNQSAAGNNNWVGHLYDGTSFNNYLGYYNIATETFQESFGTGGTWPNNTNDDNTCFNILSDGEVRGYIKDVTFSSRYRMNSTRRGFYKVDLTGDDGNRLYMDGVLVYSDWHDHSPMDNSNVLLSFSGNSSLAFEYYENGGQNTVGFNNLVSIFDNTLSTNITQTICTGTSGSPISGNIFGSLPAGISISGSGYQWAYSSTSSTGPWTDIAGATGATFTPSSATAPFNIAGTYYIIRKAILSSTNNLLPNPYLATNESNTAILTVSPELTAGVLISAIPDGDICAGTTVTFTATPTNGGSSPSYQWKVNGVNVGANEPQYITSLLANNDIVTCQLTSDLTCIQGSQVISNSITMTVISPPSDPATISVNPNSVTVSYSGQITLTSNGGGGSGAVLKWYSGGCGSGLSIGSGNSIAIAAPDATTTYYARWESGNCHSNCLSITVLVYCDATSTSPQEYESITNVTFAGINNTSPVLKTAGYTDYTSSVAPAIVLIDNSYPISVTEQFLNQPDSGYCKVFIDYNKNGIFDTSSELVFESDYKGSITMNGNITIPASATIGITRMRVVLKGVGTSVNTIPCESFQWGEVEDYSVNIIVPNYFKYRSIATGNWTNISKWEFSSDNGLNWLPASVPPSSTDGTIVIRTPDVITLNSTVTADQLTIDAGGTLTLAADMIIADGDGDDIIVNGTLNCGISLVSGTGSFSLNSGSALLIGSPYGITQSGSSGNIQTASRSYSTEANFTYNAISSQTTGNGLPATINNLSISNSAGVSLLNDVTLNGSLALNSGEFSVGSRTITFQNSDYPITRNSGTITTNENTNIIFGTSGNIAGNAFTIPAGTFTSNPILNNLTINRSNDLTLNNQMIALKGVLLCNTCTLNTSGNLSLLSTSAQTALIDGSGTGQVSGNVTMQRYLPSGFGYRYFSSPFQASTVNEFSDEINLTASFPTFYSYNEDNHIDTSGVSVYSTGWSSYISTTATLEPMRGYAANFGVSALPITVDVTGTVNNNIETSLTLFNHNRIYTQGFNLTGNPYPSPIDWTANDGWTKNNIDNAIYFFDPGVADQYTGTYSTYINNISSDGVASNIIPSMQGFFVHVTNGTYPVTAELGMDNRVRINNISPVFHKSVYNMQVPMVRLAASYGSMNKADPMVVYFENLSSAEFDKEYDALKLMNTDESIPNFYSLSALNEKLSINALPFPGDGTTISRIGLKTKKSDWVNIKALSTENIPSDIRVFLSDKLTGAVQDLNIEKDYSIFLEAGTTDNRFALLFSTKDLTQKPKTKETFFAHFANGELNVSFELPSGSTANLVACNLLGQTIMQKNITSNELKQFDFQFPSGVYILTLYSQNGIHSQKIYIPK